MLVGIGGSGKQSITRLAAFAAGCEIFEIVLSRGYNETSFREDLKTLFLQVGVRNVKTCFIFKAAQVSRSGSGSGGSVLPHSVVPLLYFSISMFAFLPAALIHFLAPQHHVIPPLERSTTTIIRLRKKDFWSS